MIDELVPAIEVTQWREGRVLSADDVTILSRMLRQRDDEMNNRVDSFLLGREQGMAECGKGELPDVIRERDASKVLAMFYRTWAEVLERQNHELKAKIAAPAAINREERLCVPQSSSLA